MRSFLGFLGAAVLVGVLGIVAGVRAEVLVAPDATGSATPVATAPAGDADEPVVHDPEAEPDPADGEDPVVQTAPEPAPTPVPWAFEHGGLGVCLGKGAGLFGVYAYARPADHFGLEADFGTRLFLFAISNGTTTSDIEVYWPLAGAFKAQYFFAGREKRFQPGIEIGALASEDMGLGGEVAAVSHLRVGRNASFDANVGIGFFPDAKNKNIDYLVKVRGRTRAYYETNAEIMTPPVMLMWGVGFSVVF